MRFKASMLQSDLCDYSNAYIVIGKIITVTDPIMKHMTRNWFLITMHHLLDVFQKLIMYLLIMQKN